MTLPGMSTSRYMNAFAADSHPGHRRSQNEDCFLADDAIGLFLVADGVGGHADGDVAAAIVRDTLRDEIGKGAGLDAAIQRAHTGVLSEIARREDSNMGSTVVAAVVSAGKYDIAWVGDSRAYSFDGTLTRLSRDHNPVSEMLAQGALTPEQAAVHPRRNVLSQSVGVSATNEVAPGRIRGQLHQGQQLILCSDGLTDELSDAVIEQIMSRETSPQMQVNALVEAALGRGGRDNITVVVVGARGRDSATCIDEPGPDPSATGTTPTGGEQLQGGSPAKQRRVVLLVAAMTVAALAWVALNNL